MSDRLEIRVLEQVARFTPLGVSPEQIDLDRTFESLSIDSMGLAELLYVIECEFGFVVIEEEFLTQTKWMISPRSIIDKVRQSR
jgi:acyl carrier protein